MKKVIKLLSSFAVALAFCVIMATTVKASAITSIGIANPETVYDTEENEFDGLNGCWYKVTLKNSGTLTFTGSCIEAPMWNNLEFRILDSAGNVVKEEHYNGSTNIFTADLLAGTYYIGSERSSGSSGLSYKAKIMYSFEAVKETVKDSVAEPHNSILTAGKFNGKKVTGFLALNDKTDVFEYKISNPSLLTVSFNSETVDYVSLNITDKKGNSVGTYNDIRLGISKYQIPVASGTYYVTVSTANNTGIYTLGLTTKKLATPKLKTVNSKTYRNATVKFTNVDYATGYEIQASLSKKFGSKVITFTKAEENLASINKLKGNKTYYVRTRAVFEYNGQKFYSDWSAVKSVKINNKKSYIGQWKCIEDENISLEITSNKVNLIYTDYYGGRYVSENDICEKSGKNDVRLFAITEEKLFVTYKAKSDTVYLGFGDYDNDVITFKRQ